MPGPPAVSGVISKTTPARLEPVKYVRNGLVPHATFETDLAYSTNYAAAVRGKELFRYACPLASIPSSDGSTRNRWRFAAHTGPTVKFLRCMLLAALQDTGDPVFSPKITVHITNADESTTYGTGVVHFGANNTAATPSDVPSEFGWGEVQINNVPADTDIYGRFEEDDGGRLIAASVCERALEVTSANGYVVPGPVAVQSPIYNDRRQALYDLGVDVWKQGAGHLFNWTVDDQASPRTNASATFKNVVDNDDTGADGPTWRIDTGYCGTRARATAVPCVFAVYAKMSGSTDSGEVSISRTGGSIVGSTITVSGTTAQWYTTTLNLPADIDDYYVEFANPDFSSGAGETISVYAVSLFQYKS